MVADTLSLAGKTALVTGSGRENGIGGAVIKTLAANGATVVLHYASNSAEARAHDLASRLRSSGATAVVVQGDISTEQGATKIVNDAIQALETKKIDILVNNSATWSPVPSLQNTWEQVHTEFATNVFGTLFVTKAAIEYMPRGGRIINVGSVASKLGGAEAGIYSATKAALNSLTTSWAEELGKSRGVTVNVIGPGPIRTDLTESDPEENFAKKVNLARGESRAATPQDVADVILLLASPKSRWVTGQFIDVSGGITGAV